MTTHDILAPPLTWFDEWRRKTAEPLPAFESMPRCSDLPPLLEFADGRLVTTADEWQARRREIQNQLHHFFFGSVPDRPPPLTGTRILSSTSAHKASHRRIELTFENNPSCTFTMEVLTPEGSGPFPVFLTQSNHRSWALLALSRGYLACVYPAADSDDQSANFAPLFPHCDWGKITRRAWTAGRALDYLLTLPEADRQRVGITGHSRNGKQSLIAASLDPRISAVVSSSSGSGGACPYRFATESAFAESVEFTTRLCPDWYHPRLRFFTGREDRLPMDMHGLVALLAPRPCLLSVACNDGVETTFAIERCYQAAREVYRFSGSPEALLIRCRDGNHETCAEDIQSYLDFFDQAFGRRTTSYAGRLLHAFNRQEWKQNSGPQLPAPLPEESGNDRRELVAWSLGEPPPLGRQEASTYGVEPGHVSARMARLQDPDGIQRMPLTFSDYVRGHLYYPTGVEAPLPVVLWLHPYSYSSGYSGAYLVPQSGPRIYHLLAQHGFAVLAFDLLGFGERLLEGVSFYQRHPRWSKLGKMVRDVQAAVDMLQEGAERPGRPNSFSKGTAVVLPRLDPERIACLGYSLGGMLGLYAAALDPRIAAVASFCGFSSLRTVPEGKLQVGFLEQVCFWHGLQPQLGDYRGRERDLPFDFGDILACIAPRPCLVVAPRHDRDADPAAVRKCLREARDLCRQRGVADRFTHLEPNDYNRFQTPQHALALQWLQEVF